MRRGRLGAAVTLSGAAALTFQVLWLRGFAIVLGSTAHAFACVVTAFMLGIALGAWGARLLFAWRGESGGWLRFAVVELGVGIGGVVVTHVLFLRADSLIRMIAAAEGTTLAQTVVVHFAASFVMLALPTFCMGASLPLLATEARRDGDVSGLYGLNTLGAMVGALLSTFVLLYYWGVLGAAWAAAGMNFAAATTALALSRASRDLGDETQRVAAPPSQLTPTALGLLAFGSGALFLGLEQVWNRLLSILLGNRVYVTSITLAMVLCAIAVGTRLAWRIGLRTPTRDAVSWAYLLAGVSLYAAELVRARGLELRELWAVGVLFVFGVMVPAIALAISLPLVLAAVPEGRRRGSHVAALLALNTVGGALGSLVTAYALFESLGSPRILMSAAVLCLLIAVFLTRGAKPLTRLGVYGMAALASLALTHRGALAVVPASRALVRSEDAHCAFSVAREGDGLLSARCNGAELVYLFGHPLTQEVQESQALLPLLFAPRSERMLVIGSGYGITAGVAGKWPGIGTVDAVELLPQMVEAAPLFASGNHRYWENPHVRVHVDDGRRFLAVASQPYDVITVNLNSPYTPGSAMFFTDEFYRALTRVLSPGGIACQHIYGPDAASLFHGFRRHFAHVLVFPSYGDGATVLGSQAPFEARQLAALQSPGLRASFATLGLTDAAGLEGLMRRGEAIRERLEAEPAKFIHSDLFPALELRRSDRVGLLRDVN